MKMKNMSKQNIFVCSKCDSDNAKVVESNIFKALCKFFRPTERQQGVVRVRCYDCGHEMLLMIDKCSFV